VIAVTKEIAVNHQGVFHHVHLRNRDGTQVRCRANGVCKTWKTRPGEFRLPVKYGLRDCFYITEVNCVDWYISDHDYKVMRRTLLCAKLGVRPDIPDGILMDLAEERLT
jgi:hypothetical protein